MEKSEKVERWKSGKVRARETGEVIDRPRARVRGLDVDGINACKGVALRPRARVREDERLLCTWREACKAADYVLEHRGGEGASDAQDRAETSAAPEEVRACPEARSGRRSGA